MRRRKRNAIRQHAKRFWLMYVKDRRVKERSLALLGEIIVLWYMRASRCVDIATYVQKNRG